MKRTIFLLSIVGILAVVGCDDDEVVIIAERSSSIAGVVVDSDSQLPLDSVALTQSDTSWASSFYSDTLGIFKYVIFGGGVQRVFFQKQGYDTKFLDINFTDNPKDIKIELVKQ